MTTFVSASVDMTLRSVCSGSSDESKSTSVVHESPGVQTDDSLEGRSTTHGQTDVVDHDSDEEETSIQEQNHDTDLTPDAAAASWPDTATSTSTDYQPHDSTVHAHPRASDPVTRTVAVTSKIRHERSSSIAQTRRQDNEGTLQPAAASCWTDTAASTPSRPLQCRSTATSKR